MQKYINHLLQDIASVYNKTKEPCFSDDNQAFFEKEIKEVERFIYEDPYITLSQHTALPRVVFPDEKLLTKKQCVQLREALKEAYFKLGVCLAIPADIPAKVSYRFYVEALDKAVFVNKHGMMTVEYCHYDYTGDCPFGVKECSCYREMEEEVENIRQKSMNEWSDIEALEVYWYDFLEDYGICQLEFKNSSTPNKVKVQKLWMQLDQTHQSKVKEDPVIYYAIKEEEMPDGEYKSLFEWLGVGRVIFPKRSQLSVLELRLLSMALIRLCGKELIVLPILDWELGRQYDELVAHHSRWMKKDENAQYLKLLCLPQPINLFDTVKAEQTRFRSNFDL